jgi:hypothetical protein
MKVGTHTCCTGMNRSRMQREHGRDRDGKGTSHTLQATGRRSTMEPRLLRDREHPHELSLSCISHAQHVVAATTSSESQKVDVHRAENVVTHL